MRRIEAGLLAALSLFLAGCAVTGQTVPAVEGLRCEYLTDPLGIDMVKPRLSWRLAPGPNGLRQTAYRILAASSAEALRNNKGDLWDSHRVESPQSTFVPYDGAALASGTEFWWKVRVWRQDGRAAAWSEPARWSMGILNESEWYGRFIGQARPVGVREGTPLPFPWLRKTFELSGKPRRGTAYVNALGYYELYVNGRKVDDYVLAPAVSDYSKRTLYVTHDITDYLVAGRNCVALWLGRGWYVKGHPGVIHDGPLARAQIEVAMPRGNPLRVGTDATWKVRPSPVTPVGKGTAFGDYGGEHYDANLELEGWNSAGLNDADWEPAAVFDPPRVMTAAQMVEPNRIVETLEAAKIEENPAGAWLIDIELARRADVIVCVDNERVADELARAARNRKTQVSVLVDVDVGLHRCGVPPGEATLRLARTLVEKGLRLRGLMGYEGQVLRKPPGPEKEAAAAAAMGPLMETKAALEREGLPVDIVSVGGTGTYSISGRYPGVTEIQAGSYLLMDSDYRKCCTDFDLALTLLTTVISKTPGERIVVDAGLKTLSCERGIPAVKDLPGLTTRRLTAEHGIIDLEDPSAPVESGWRCTSPWCRMFPPRTFQPLWEY